MIMYRKELSEFHPLNKKGEENVVVVVVQLPVSFLSIFKEMRTIINQFPATAAVYRCVGRLEWLTVHPRCATTRALLKTGLV